jgi:hypothetical protein
LLGFRYPKRKFLGLEVNLDQMTNYGLRQAFANVQYEDVGDDTRVVF